MRSATFAACIAALACGASAEHSTLRDLSQAERARLILPDDLVYKGAFRFPKTHGQPSRWGYGGKALTYCPKGDPNGPDDGYPGSLFGSGHAHHNLVSEISIPVPVLSPNKNIKDLSTATTLQPFSDITGGLKGSLFPKYKLNSFGGLAYLPGQGEHASDKLYWCFFLYYNVSNVDHPSYGRSELNLSKPDAAGVWHAGPYKNGDYHARKTGNYLFEIPKDWANRYVGGRCLATGNANGPGLANASHGPSLYAIAPHQHGHPPPDGAELEAVMLLMYPYKGVHYPDWGPCDAWEGGAWLAAGEKSAVAFVGRKGANKANSYYGLPKPGAAHGSKGYHADPYESQFVLYDPDDLADVAQGRKKHYEVVPYAIHRPAEYFWPRKDGQTGATAYDRERGLLYVVQQNGENPICHVFSIPHLLEEPPPPEAAEPAPEKIKPVQPEERARPEPEEPKAVASAAPQEPQEPPRAQDAPGSRWPGQDRILYIVVGGLVILIAAAAAWYLRRRAR